MKGKYVLKSVMALLALCGILSISRLSVEAAEIGEDVAVSDNEVKEQIIEESVDLESAAPVLRDIKFTCYDSDNAWFGHLEIIGENIDCCSGIVLENVEIVENTSRGNDVIFFFNDRIEAGSRVNFGVRGSLEGSFRIKYIQIYGTDGKVYCYYPEVPWDKMTMAKEECDCDGCRNFPYYHPYYYHHKADVYQQLPEKFKNMIVTFAADGNVTNSNSGSAQEYICTRERGGPVIIPRPDNFQFRAVSDSYGYVGCSMDYPLNLKNWDSVFHSYGYQRTGDPLLSGMVGGHMMGAIVRNKDSYEERRILYADHSDYKQYNGIDDPGNWALDEIIIRDIANPTVFYHYCVELPLGITNGTEIYTKGGWAPLYTDIYYQLPESMKGLGFSIGANREVQINDVTTQQTKNFVSRLYTVALGRDAEEAGLNDWTNRLLTKQENAAQVARGFFFSDEFKNRNYSDEEFVELLYQTMFGRAGDEGGTQYWLSCLENGVSREYVYHGFAESQEFSELCSNYGLDRGSVTLSQYRDRNADATGFIARLYTKMLGRKFDEDGLEYWCKAYLTGEKSIEVIASDGFLHSEELKNMNLSNEEFVTRMYETFLNREPEEAGLNDWVGRLERGEETRDSLVYGFTNSREFGGLKAEYHLP